MKKNILVSLLIIGVLSALIIGGTGAIFFDEEVARNNVFEAGYIDLKTRKEGETSWRQGETKIWETPKNWAPNQRESGTIHLRNDGNMDAGRATIHIATGIENASETKVNDSRVLDRTDMDRQIRITKATFGGSNVADLIGKTLYQLRGDTIELGSGIDAGAERSLFLEFKFDCKGKKCAGYMGDKVETNFTFGLHQELAKK